MKIKHPYSIKITGTLIILINIFTINLWAQPSNNCSYTWVPQSSGTLNIFYTVKAVNEFVCWTAGSNGTVRRTTDGGTTWLNGNPNTGVIIGDILYIEATDENNALATTSQSNNTFIYKTTNAGENWIQVYTSTGGFINGIHMISATHGYAFGDPKANIWNILTTTDGGSNWTLLPTAPQALIGEQGFQNGFFVLPPYMWFGAFFGNAYRTTNNGINWTSHETTGINGFILAFHFNSLSLGLASSTNMIRSTDAGSSYFPLSVPGLGNITAIEGSGTEFWYVRGDKTYRSTDSGENWAVVNINTNTQRDIDFPDNSTGCRTGWVVGHAGTITKITVTLTGIENNQNEFPENYSLKQNYPNPFNPVTNISYSLPKAGYVKISVFDISGREIQTVVNEFKNAGTHIVSLNASDFSSGLYFYKMTSADYSETKSMILLK
ncbi:MAG: T9SS type A sorting domain-containing protein [Ignavibacteria bacterium]|nr:T9SS type A sorting domain-containing protein [Ignavibacteria bacterium]